MNLSEYLAKLQQKEHTPKQAFIRESECIGCTKCLQACPVDTIVGAAKQMHTVITRECTGCELCVEPCPVDCIDMIPVTKPAFTLDQVRNRFEARIRRLSESVKATKKPPVTDNLAAHKAYIKDALARVKAKNLFKISTMPAKKP